MCTPEGKRGRPKRRETPCFRMQLKTPYREGPAKASSEQHPGRPSANPPYEAHLTPQALNDSRMALVYGCPCTVAGDAGVRKDGVPDEAEDRDERPAGTGRIQRQVQGVEGEEHGLGILRTLANPSSWRRGCPVFCAWNQVGLSDQRCSCDAPSRISRDTCKLP